MSSRALGNSRESALADSLDALGYAVVALRGSGSRGAAMRRRKNGVTGDLLAIPADKECSLPHLQIECGGSGKRIGKAFAELRSGLLPGFTPLVVCWQKRLGRKVSKRYHYTSVDECFGALEDAITTARRAA